MTADKLVGGIAGTAGTGSMSILPVVLTRVTAARDMPAGMWAALVGLIGVTAGKRWLAEADSFLFEAPPAQRNKAIRNYLITAPLVIAVSWASALAQRIRVTGG